MRTARLCLLAVWPVLLLATAGAASGQDAAQPAFTAEQERFFEEKVRPLLAARCFDCHGPGKEESGLRLDSRERVLKGGESGEKAVVAGHPEQSLLVKAIKREGDYKMPPSDRERLLPAEIDTLSTWIKLGLPWGQSAKAELSMDERYAQARRNHWAFQPIQRPAIASTGNTAWLANRVDAFVLPQLTAAGLTTSPAADRQTLIRRATYDLLGLPPTPEEVDEFLASKEPDAYQRLLDRLLASPHYGERWGRHWLDVARYADTRGYALQKEPNFPYAYTFRDYVVRSLNEDLPYDQFVVEQLAADLLPPTGDNRRLAALGYLTVGRKYLNRNDDFDDQVDVVTRGMLGLTVACARCHDHKYDAIPTEDYYSLFGIFANCRQPDDLPLLGDPSDSPTYAAFQAEREQLRKAAADYVVQRRDEVVGVSRKHATDYLVRAASALTEPELEKLPFIRLKGEDHVKPKIVEQWKTYLAGRPADDPVFGPWVELAKVPPQQFAEQAPAILARWQDVPTGLKPGNVYPLVKAALAASPPQSRIELARLYGKLLEDALVQWQAAAGTSSAARSPAEKLSPEVAMLARVQLDDNSPTNLDINEPRDFFTRVDRNKQDELKKKADELEVRSPNAPPRAMILADNSRIGPSRVFLRGNQNRPGKEVPRQFVKLIAGEERKPFQQGSGRLELAQAIVAADNPLTARVIANRVWMHHFDAPLVSSPSDFGIRSDPPTHPALLDDLASRLLSSGWSLKDLHRQIMASSTYRQTSINRPECKAVDPENRLLWRMNRRRLEFEPLRDSLLAMAGGLDSKIGGRVGDVTSPAFHRRALYGKVDRQDLPNLLRVFDFASPDQSSPGRSRTTVPQQALFLLNSPFAVEQARGVAARLDAASDEPAKIAELYRLILVRPPTTDEIKIGVEFLAAASGREGAKLSPWEQYAQLLLWTNEVMYVD